MKLLFKALASLSFPLAVMFGLAIGPTLVATETGCGVTGQQIQTAAGPIAKATLDGITCVTSVASLLAGPQSLAAVAAACTQFGVDVDLAYNVIKSMLTTTVAPGGGLVGAPDPALVGHLVKLLNTK